MDWPGLLAIFAVPALVLGGFALLVRRGGADATVRQDRKGRSFEIGNKVGAWSLVTVGVAGLIVGDDLTPAIYLVLAGLAWLLFDYHC